MYIGPAAFAGGETVVGARPNKLLVKIERSLKLLLLYNLIVCYIISSHIILYCMIFYLYYNFENAAISCNTAFESDSV